MPTYTYRCQKCGNEFERFQSMTDDPVKRCPECKGKVHRTFHPVGIVLKGSGFYKTDSRAAAKTGSRSEEKTSSSDTKGETKGESKSDPKSDSKSDSKTESKTTDAKSSPKTPSETSGD